LGIGDLESDKWNADARREESGVVRKLQTVYHFLKEINNNPEELP
jgi:hypothetical protein